MAELYRVYSPKTTLEMTWREAEATLRETDTAILVVGATEQHGPHNPMGLDTFVPLEIAKRAVRLLEAQGVKVLITTPIPFGMSHHHLPYPGSIALRPETLEALIFDIGTSLVDQGVNNLLLFVGHTSVEQEGCCVHAALHLQRRYGMMTGTFNWFREYQALLKADPVLRGDAVGFDAHAGEGETSMMLAIAPHLVDRARMVPSVTEDAEWRYRNPTTKTLRKGGHRGARSQLLVPVPGPKEYSAGGLGHVGDPSTATPELGHARLDALATQLVKLLRDMRTLSGKWSGNGPHRVDG
jgi:creatinine amidohydrolase